jgi:hypothetical protein
MSPTKPFQKTPLTEQQARTLAYWWGGQYQRISLAEGENVNRHGVVVTGKKSCRPQGDAVAPIQIFSLEEAVEMENRRGFQEACSPDWVG